MPLQFYLLIPILFIASWNDWQHRRIPNSLLFPSFLTALAFSFLTMGFDGLVYSLTGTALGFALLIIPYLLGGMGAGDVKYLMVIGSFGGSIFVLYSFVYGAIIGGVITVGIYIQNRNQKEKICTIPYGIPLTLGTALCLFLGNWR